MRALVVTHRDFYVHKTEKYLGTPARGLPV